MTRQLFITLLAVATSTTNAFSVLHDHIGSENEPNKIVYDEQNRIKTIFSDNNRIDYAYEGSMTIKTSGYILPDTTIKTFIYNDKGLCEKTRSTLNGNFIYEEQRFYKGNLLDSVVTKYDGSPELNIDLYDSHGHKYKSYYYSTETSSSNDTIYYKCDANGNIIEEKWSDFTINQKYDEKNRMTFTQYQSNTDSDKAYGTIEENKEGWTIVYKSISGKEKSEKTKIDKQGNIIEKHYFSEQFEDKKEFFTYDKKGRLLKEISIKWPGKESGIDIINTPVKKEYINEKGLVTKVEFFNQMMQPTTQCQYTYDAQGKLIKETWYDRHHKILDVVEY